MTSGDNGDVIEELRDWLAAEWDPDLTVGEWWEKLGLAGWSMPLLAPDAYGRGVSRGDAVKIGNTIAEHGAMGPPAGLGLMLAAPTISVHGTAEQIEKFIPDIVTGRRAWCQLFSEPGAGSDLAGLNTKAEKDGDVWHVNGQKVWTSGGNSADLGMLLARTNPEAPKHQGITYFGIDMHQPGVDVRPLKEMTGHAMFSEVFLSDAIVHDDDRIDAPNSGWKVANTTLLWERSSMGAGGGRGRGAVLARPGTIANDLDKRVGDFAGAPPKKKKAASDSQPKKRVSPATPYIELAKRVGKLDDKRTRQQLMRLHTFGELARMNTERHKAVRAQGGDIPGIANFSKLMMADVMRLNRDLGMQLLGARGTLHAYDPDGNKALAEALGSGRESSFTAQALGAQALPIYGGTDQIQRNIIGERVLGLPKEPGDFAQRPFSEIPKNG